jgi:hypothetical protein
MRVIGGLMLGLLAAVCQGQSQQMGSILQQAGVGAVSSSAEVGAENKVKDTKFSMDRGYYDSPFNVIVSTATEGATIVYTLDGSNPLTSSSAKSTPAPAEVPMRAR